MNFTRNVILQYHVPSRKGFNSSFPPWYCPELKDTIFKKREAHVRYKESNENVSAKPPPVVATEPSYYGGHGEVYLYLSILIYVPCIYRSHILIHTDRYMYTNYTRTTLAHIVAILLEHPHKLSDLY